MSYASFGHSGENTVYQVDVLRQSLPFIQAMRGQCIVIGFLADTLQNQTVRADWMREIAFLLSLGICPVVVHGLPITAGNMNPLASQARVALEETSFDLVQSLKQEGVRAIGLHGQDGLLAQINSIAPTRADHKATGHPLVSLLLKSGMVPVFKATVTDEHDQLSLVAPETFAATLADQQHARSLILVGQGSTSHPIGMLDRHALAHWLQSHENTNETSPYSVALSALQKGVKTIHLLDCIEPASLLASLMTFYESGTVLCYRGLPQMLEDTARYFSDADCIIRPDLVVKPKPKWIARF